MSRPDIIGRAAAMPWGSLELSPLRPSHLISVCLPPTLPAELEPRVDVKSFHLRSDLGTMRSISPVSRDAPNVTEGRMATIDGLDSSLSLVTHVPRRSMYKARVATYWPILKG